uniref:DH domain-containing protein n=1 Tax=Poecilia mexicana TaxID=48701 RepID=A0A3B3WHI6_9TELE
ADLLGLEAESWSLAVCPDFCRQHDRRTIKRQDVIYGEFFLSLVLAGRCCAAVLHKQGGFQSMLEELQLDSDCVARIFPCLDPLLLFHRNLFRALQERRQAATQTDNSRNYLIHRIGDVLLQQFSDENAETMKQVYGEFCSHHMEAVNVFKELQQQNKKFQSFVRQQSNNSLVRRREVPEFILLVTQRITKYPVLLEKILQYTQEEEEEEERTAETEEARQAAEVRVQKISKFQGNKKKLKIHLCILNLSFKKKHYKQQVLFFVFVQKRCLVRTSRSATTWRRSCSCTLSSQT